MLSQLPAKGVKMGKIPRKAPAQPLRIFMTDQIIHDKQWAGREGAFGHQASPSLLGSAPSSGGKSRSA